VIFDSLRSFNPAMENDNTAAAKQIRQLRAISRRHGTAILLVHHVRKHATQKTGLLEESAPLDWLMRAAGSRALINQTDARLAISRRKNGGDTLMMRGHLRTRGEIGPWLLARVWDDTGEPQAYRRFSPGPQMLETAEQQAAFARLPEAFSFSEACAFCGKQNQATCDYLQKLIRLGLVSKIERGKYRKNILAPEGGPGEQVDMPSAA
jgi:hypothetical protein